MHLKNFSLMHTDRGILFSPAYDLLNVNLIFPNDDEDLALTLNGRKKKIKREDFDQFAQSIQISDKVKDNIYKQFSGTIEQVRDIILSSFLPIEQQERYFEIFKKKLKQIGLS